jgi:hypothetical protein
MKSRLNDSDPGRKAITNADEQEVAVNHSTAESGYDKPNPPEPPSAAPEKPSATPGKPVAENDKTEQKKKTGKGVSSDNKNF